MSHDRGGLEFTLSAVIPPLPPCMTFGEMDIKSDSLEMVRCITAHQLWKKYRVASKGDVFHPWMMLLVTCLDETTLVSPTTLLTCLENLRTIVEPEDTLCFHLADIYRGSFLRQHWLQLIAIVHCRQARIHFLNRQSYTPDNPTAVTVEALSILHDWFSTNMGDRSLRRTVWQDRRAIFEHLAPQSIDDQSGATGKWLITQPKTRPNYLSWITYANTDVLQAPGTEVLCCPADLVSYSAITRYVIRNTGKRTYFVQGRRSVLRLAWSTHLLHLGVTRSFFCALEPRTSTHYCMKCCMRV